MDSLSKLRSSLEAQGSSFHLLHCIDLTGEQRNVETGNLGCRWMPNATGFTGLEKVRSLKGPDGHAGKMLGK